MVSPMTAPTGRPLAPSPEDAARIVGGVHHDPHAILGRHGGIVRAFHPDASGVEVLTDGAALPMKKK